MKIVSKELESEIFKHLRHHCWVIPGYANLDRHTRLSILHDAYMSLIIKYREDKLDLDAGFEHYKHYMFITLKSKINKVFKFKATRYQKAIEYVDGFADEPSYSPKYKHHNVNRNEYLNSINPIERAIFRWHFRWGWSYVYISKMLGLNERLICRQSNNHYKKMITFYEDKF